MTDEAGGCWMETDVYLEDRYPIPRVLEFQMVAMFNNVLSECMM